MTIQRVSADWLPKYIAGRQPHYLYRCYDGDGRLVYIGCTADPKRRMTTHMAGQHSTASTLLQRFMARHEVDGDVYPGSVAGHTAEKAAIRAEQPIFNQQHTGVPMWKRNGEIARYIYSSIGQFPATRYDEDGFETGYLIDPASLAALFSAEAVA